MEKINILHTFAFLYSISNEFLYTIMNQKRNQKLLRIFFFLISWSISNGVSKNLWPINSIPPCLNPGLKKSAGWVPL